MARRIKLKNPATNVEEALGRVLENEFREDITHIAPAEQFKIGDLKQKIEALNSTNEPLESLSVQIPNYTTSDPDFIKELKAANDDKNTPPFSQIFPKHSPFGIYVTSAIISMLWLGGSFSFTYYIWENSHKAFAEFMMTPAGLSSIGYSLLPVALIGLFAKLFKNSKDLTSMIKSLVSSQLNVPAPASDFAKISRHISYEVDNMDKGLQKTFERASELETLVHGEVQYLERAYSENEDKIRKLMAMLANERQAILDHADRVKSTLQLTSNEISTDLSEVTDKISLNIEAIAERLSQKLNEKTKFMLDNLQAISGSLTGDLIEDINDKGTTYLDQLDMIFANVKKGIESHTSDSINVFTNKLTEIGDAANIIVDQFGHKFDNMDDLLQRRSEQALQNFEGQLDNFNALFNCIPERLSVATKQALVECEKNLIALDDMLSDQSKSAITSFITYSISIEEHTDKLTALLDSRVTEINSSIKNHIEGLSTTIDSGKEDLLRTADEAHMKVVSELSKIEDRIAYLFNNRDKTLEEKFVSSNNYIANIINNESSTMAGSIQQQIKLLSEHLNTIEQDFVIKLIEVGSHNDTQLELIKNYNNNLSEKLNDGLTLLEKNITTYNQRLDEKGQVLQSDIDNSFINILNEQTLVINKRIENLRKLILSNEEHLGEVFDNHLKTYEEKLNGSKGQISKELQEHLALLASYTDNVHNAINRTENLQVSLSSHLHNSVQESIQHLEHNTIGIGTILGEKIKETANLLTQEAYKAKEYVENINVDLSNSITNFEQGFSRAHNHVMKSAQYVTEHLRQETDSTTQKILKTGEHLNSSLMQVSAEIEKRIQERSALLNDASAQIYKKIDEHLHQVGTSIHNLREYKEEHFANQIKELAQTTQAVYNAARTTSEAISNTKKQINDQIANTAQEVRQQFTLENKDLLETIAQRSTEISNSLEHFNNIVAKNIITITDQLSHSSNSIFARTNELVNNIQNTENNIYSTVEQFNQNATQIGQDLSNRFKEHATLLSTAANLLDKAQHNFDDNIYEKQHALNMLTETLASKTDEITKAINYYEQLLDNNLNKMTQQAKVSLNSFTQEIQDGLGQAVANFTNSSDNLKLKAQSINQEMKLGQSTAANFETHRESLKQAINNQAYALNDVASVLSNDKAPSDLSLKSIAAHIVKGINLAELAAMWRRYNKYEVNIQPQALYNAEGLELAKKLREEYYSNFTFKKAIDKYINEFEQILKNINTQKDPNGIFNALQTNSGIVYTVLAHISGRLQ